MRIGQQRIHARVFIKIERLVIGFAKELARRKFKAQIAAGNVPIKGNFQHPAFTVKTHNRIDLYVIGPRKTIRRKKMEERIVRNGISYRNQRTEENKNKITS